MAAPIVLPEDDEPRDANPYVSVDWSLWTHPKRRRLERALGTGMALTIGLLTCLWHFACMNAQDGDLGRFDDEDVADACGWEGEPGPFVAALIASGFVTSRRHIYDWYNHAGRYFRRKAMRAAAARERRAREVGTSPTQDPTPDHITDVSPTRDRHVGDTSQTRSDDVTPPCIGSERIVSDRSVSERIGTEEQPSQRLSGDDAKPAPKPPGTALSTRKRADPGTASVTTRGPGSAAWDAYEEAYTGRYGVPPVRNAAANAAMKRLVQSVGEEIAPAVARFYVGLNKSWYVTHTHDPRHLAQDAASIHTQLMNGRPIHSHEARDVDRMGAKVELIKNLNELEAGIRARQAAERAERAAENDCEVTV